MNPLKDQKTIRELKPGNRITGYFTVRKIELKTKRDQSPYLLLELGDSTGRIHATVWDNVKTIQNSIQTGDIVKIQGTVNEFNKRIQINIEKMRKSTSEDGIQKLDFVPRSQLDSESLKNKLNNVIQSVKTKIHVKVTTVYEDNLLGSAGTIFANKQFVSLLLYSCR